MKKVLVVLAIIAALWTVPATRSKMVIVAQPLLTKLGPFGERLITPAHRYSARTDVKRFIKRMREDTAQGKRLPEARGFTAWANYRQDEDVSVDPWGNAYWMARKGRQVTVGSNGPDGRRETADDLTETAAF